MKLSTALLAFLSFMAVASAFKIRTYNETGCEGESKLVNVWDNTCRDNNVMNTQSFEVLAYGARRQRAVFYRDPACFAVNENDRKMWWADGGSDDFKKGECMDIGFTAEAFGSQSA